MLRVLLVDDEPFIVQGLSVLIDWEAEGYEVVGMAANGEEALEFLKVNQVELIIADIKMPVMSGIELLEIIKKDRISDAYFVILSGYSDFNYAQQAIRFECMDYILKPVQQEELTRILRKVSGMYQTKERALKESRQMEKAYLSRNVISLLSGKYDQINIDYVKAHMRLSEKMRYIDIEIDALSLPEEMEEEKKRAMQRQLYQKCMEYLGKEDSLHCIFDVANHEYGYDIGFLYCSYMAEERGLTEQQFLDAFSDTLTRETEAPVLMFVGSLAKDMDELSESYRTAAIVKSFQAFSSIRNITYYENEIRKNHDGTILCKQNLDALVTAVEQNNQADINQSVRQLYEVMNRLGMDAQLIDLNISYLLFQLIHLAAEQDDHVNQEEIMHYISTNAFDRGTMRGSERHLRRFAYEYAEYLVQLRKNVSRGVLGDIEKEIKEHYMENMTLKELSKKYYVNSAYLGQLFRKQYGQSFKDYLNNYRIEQAAALLLRTDKKIYEIAEEVGYHDLDYFINRFISVKGCTPAKFRKQSREQKN